MSSSSTGGPNGQDTPNTEELLNRLIETFRSGCIVLETPSENRETILTETINMAISQMQQLADQTRLSDSDVTIPMEIFHYLDHGDNPERFVKDSLEQCFKKNQQTHAKVFALDALRDQLAHDFKQEFPEQYQTFIEQAGPQCPIKPVNEAKPPSQQQPPAQPADSDDELVEVVPQGGSSAKGNSQAPANTAVNVAGDDEEEVVSYIKRSRSTNVVDVVPDDDSMQ